MYDNVGIIAYDTDGIIVDTKSFTYVQLYMDDGLSLCFQLAASAPKFLPLSLRLVL